MSEDRMEDLESKAFEVCSWAIEGASGGGGTGVAASHGGERSLLFSSPDWVRCGGLDGITPRFRGPSFCRRNFLGSR